MPPATSGALELVPVFVMRSVIALHRGVAPIRPSEFWLVTPSPAAITSGLMRPSAWHERWRPRAPNEREWAGECSGEMKTANSNTNNFHSPQTNPGPTPPPPPRMEGSAEKSKRHRGRVKQRTNKGVNRLQGFWNNAIGSEPPDNCI